MSCVQNRYDDLVDHLIEPPADFIRGLLVEHEIKTRLFQKMVKKIIDSHRKVADAELHHELNLIELELDQWIISDPVQDENDDDEPEH